MALIYLGVLTLPLLLQVLVVLMIPSIHLDLYLLGLLEVLDNLVVLLVQRDPYHLYHPSFLYLLVFLLDLMVLIFLLGL